MSSRVLLFSSISVLILFLFMRFFLISESFLFFGDMGRDFNVLHTWLETGKPPLLGPQNSALPFNQSPIYFYYLMPFYLISNHSLYATLIATAVFHIAVFAIGMYLVKEEKSWSLSWIIVWLLFALSPQLIIQHRYVWNPSFVAACTALAFFSLIVLRKKMSILPLVSFVTSLALAVGFSYSAAPTAIVFVLSLPILFSFKNALKILGSTILAGLIIHLPLVFFELRHNFTLTNLMLHYEKLDQQTLPAGQTFWHIFELVFSVPQYRWLSLLSIMTIVLFIAVNKLWKAQKPINPLLISVALLATNILLLILLPVTVQAHYIFGVVALLCISVAFLGVKTRLLLLTPLLLMWLQPSLFNQYFGQSWRTTEETIACAKQVCQQVSGPTFVSIQSAYHTYHTAPEFRYLFDKHGCEVINIEEPPELVSNVKQMLVVTESSSYDHGRTTFDELSKFGTSQYMGQIDCSEKLRVHVLHRN
ncbi:MAG: hypothetical protein QG639_1100 [Patescibacteria group bacterium]|nr:hypothetical protein [Patescibacteria group bacterium]